MNLVLYKHHIYINALCCDSRIKPILTHTPEDPFLEIDVKGGREIMYVVINYQKGGDLKHKCSLGDFGN